MKSFWKVTMVAVAVMCFAVVSLAHAEEQKEIGVMWIGKSAMPERVLKGMLTALKGKAPNIKPDIKMALPDEETAAKVYADFQKNKAAIVFLRSTGTKFMGKNPPSIPAFVGATSNPVELGAMKDMNKPDANITGVTYYLPAAQHFAIYRKLFPNMKTVALIVEKGHPSTAVDVAETKAECETAGIEFIVKECVAKEDVAKAAAEVKEKADLIILGNQGLVIDNAALAAMVAGNKPIAAYAEKPVTQKVAMVGLAVDDEKLGEMLGDSVIDVVNNGKAVADVPVKTDTEPRLLINKAKAEAMGISIPDDIKAKATMIE